MSRCSPRQLTPSRCRLRSSCHGHSFDPIVFGDNAPRQVEGMPAGPEDAEEDADEVLFYAAGFIQQG